MRSSDSFFVCDCVTLFQEPGYQVIARVMCYHMSVYVLRALCLGLIFRQQTRSDHVLEQGMLRTRLFMQYCTPYGVELKKTIVTPTFVGLLLMACLGTGPI